MAVEEDVGQVSDFFARPVVAGIEPQPVASRRATPSPSRGHTTDITMKVESMQVNNVQVSVPTQGPDRDQGP